MSDFYLELLYTRTDQRKIFLAVKSIADDKRVYDAAKVASTTTEFRR